MKSFLSKEKVIDWVLYILIFIGCVMPTAYTNIKFFMLFLLVLMLISKYFSTGAYIYKPLLGLSVLLSFMGFFQVIHGVINNNPGALSSITVIAIYPILFSFIGFFYNGELSNNKIDFLFSSVSYGVIFLDTAFVLGQIFFPGNFLSTYLNNIYPEWAVVDNADYYFKFTLPNVSTIVFLLPFFLTKLISTFERKININFFVTIFLIILTIASGRRAIFLSTFLAILFAYVFTKNKKTLNKKNVSFKHIFYILIFIIIGIVLVYITVMLIDSNYFIEQMSSIFDFTNNESNLLRLIQYNALLEGFYSSPIFGNGAGAVASIVRSENQPWAYELSYIATLFHYGLFGMFCYSIGIILIIVSFIKIINFKGRNCFEFRFLVGFMAFMIANATNPYLGKFDYMWIIFIPYAIINEQLIKKHAKHNNH